MFYVIEMSFVAQSVILNQSLDEGIPEIEHFRFESNSIDSSELEVGDIFVKVIVLSADPYLRGRIRTSDSLGAKSANSTIHPGQRINGFVAGVVLFSKRNDWKPGDLFGAHLPFTTYQIIKGESLDKTIIWNLSEYIELKDISYGIGVLGMTGATAYGGVFDVLRPKTGETIFISAASGAVGGTAGMIAKAAFDCVAIGSCGGPEKCNIVKNIYKFDHAIDYKKLTNSTELVTALKEVSPNGIDMYFENVGGFHFDAALEVLRPAGRIGLCGQIKEYNQLEAPACSINPLKMIYSNQRIEGFSTAPWISNPRWRDKFLQDMSKWLREGKLIVSCSNYFREIV